MKEVQSCAYTGCSKKTGPAYVFSHPDFNFIPMKLKFYEMSTERIIKETMLNQELHNRIFCVKNYYKCGSVKKISEQFHTFFEIDRELHKQVIQDWVSKFETYGTAVNLNKKSSDSFSHSGRSRTRSKLQRWYRNLLSGAQNDRFGVAAKSLNLSMSTGRKVIVVDLNKQPYRMQIKQKLTVADKKDMAEKMAEKNQKCEWSGCQPLAFFPQGYLTDRVFANKPKNISEVKVSISEEIRASSNFQVCLQKRNC